MQQTILYDSIFVWDNNRLFIPNRLHTYFKDWLDKIFPEKFTGQGGPYLWPARISDFTLCDFSCGDGKNKKTRKNMILQGLELLK